MSVQKASLQIVQCISDSIVNAFKVQLNQDIKAEWKRQSDVSGFEPDIGAAIQFQSTQFSGLLALLFQKKEFLHVANSMLGENYQDISAENADAISELLNITYASARTKINESGNDFKPAIPCLYKGPPIKVSHTATTPPVILVCNSSFGEFRAEFSLRAIK